MSHSSIPLNRRAFFQTSFAASAMMALPARLRSASADALLPSFQAREIKTSGATINAVIGGSGPPLLLIHGYPETHVMWHKIAPALAQKFTVVITDLRGYSSLTLFNPAGFRSR